MKTNEIRIGNLVDYAGETAKITLVAGESVVIKLPTRTIRTVLNEYWIGPIPLTEEWLLKFGFIVEKVNNNEDGIDTWYFKENEATSFGLCLKNSKWIFYISDSPCDYVHQVQNLYFALTGEDLTVE